MHKILFTIPGLGYSLHGFSLMLLLGCLGGVSITAWRALTTFSEFVRGRRLARAHRMLTDPRCADRSISTIAFEVGFGDLSYFNHAFRRLYGATPSDVRAGASRDETMAAPGLASKRRNLWAGRDIFS